MGVLAAETTNSIYAWSTEKDTEPTRESWKKREAGMWTASFLRAGPLSHSLLLL